MFPIISQMFLLFICAILISVMMAAGKNPKRVAAGKKAWRNRGKGKKRPSSRGGTRRTTKKRRIKGVSGRVGAFLIGVAPPLIAGVEAVAATASVKKIHKLSGLGAFQFGFNRFINDLTHGFLGKKVFEEQHYPLEDEGTKLIQTGQGVPAGGLWAVAGTGFVLLAYDWLASKLTSGSGTKIPFTNIYATGNA